MKEKRLLQRLGKAVVSASSHKGLACAHMGDTHAQGSAGRQELQILVHVCTNPCSHPGQLTEGKIWFYDNQWKFFCCNGLTSTSNEVPAMRKKINSVPDEIRTTVYRNACPFTPNTTCSVGAPSLKIKHSTNQPLQTNGCSGMYGDAECKEYKNNDLLQKYPDVLASRCA